jgi:hypothetical protein
MSRRTTAVLAFIVVLSTSACTADGDAASPATPAAAPQIPEVAWTDPVLLPDEYERAGRMIDEARFSLTSACMRSKGFRFEQAVEPNVIELFVLGDPDMAHRKRYGYSNPEMVDSIESVPRERREAFMAALSGDGEPSSTKTIDTPMGQAGAAGGGCVESVRLALSGSSLRFVLATSVAEDHRAVTDRQVQEAPEVVAAVVRWRTCVEARGYDYQNPRAMAFDLTVPRRSGRSVPKANIEAAIADGECQVEADMPAALAFARSRVVDGLTEKDGRQLREVAAARREILRQAVRVDALAAEQGW